MLSADHQNKPDVGSAIARRWIDTEGVDMIIDLPNSAVALAVAGIAREKNKVVIGSGAGSALLTGASCSPNTVHWTYDTWAMGHGLARGVLQQGGKTWFFITADYAFGHDLEKQASEEVLASGGKVLGAVRHPIANNDFSSFLLQAQASGAEVIALANAGGDTVNTIKQAAEFKLGDKQKVVALIFDLQSVPATRPCNRARSDGAQRVLLGCERRHARLVEAFPGTPWQEDDAQPYACGRLCRRRCITSRVSKRSARLGWRSRGSRDESHGHRRPAIRPREGPRGWTKAASDASPAGESQAESKGEWDVFKIVGTIEADKAFRPLKEGGCPLVK